MVSPDLIAAIEERFRAGKRSADIRESLQKEGWNGEDIDQAIRTIQHNALKQLPVVSLVYKYSDVLEQRTANASPKFIAISIIGAFLIVGILSVALYMVFDPLNTQGTKRDVIRETDFVKLRSAIQSYYQAKKEYPSSLSKLVPAYLPAVPLDPRTGSEYRYTYQAKNAFELCVTFETKTAQCLSTGNDANSIIPQGE